MREMLELYFGMTDRAPTIGLVLKRAATSALLLGGWLCDSEGLLHAAISIRRAHRGFESACYSRINLKNCHADIVTSFFRLPARLLLVFISVPLIGEDVSSTSPFSGS